MTKGLIYILMAIGFGADIEKMPHDLAQETKAIIVTLFLVGFVEFFCGVVKKMREENK